MRALRRHGVDVVVSDDHVDPTTQDLADALGVTLFGKKTLSAAAKLYARLCFGALGRFLPGPEKELPGSEDIRAIFLQAVQKPLVTFGGL